MTCKSSKTKRFAVSAITVAECQRSYIRPCQVEITKNSEKRTQGIVKKSHNYAHNMQVCTMLRPQKRWSRSQILLILDEKSQTPFNAEATYKN
ncbi:CLUMA_CG014866, isoform A [Clunio marinus]|uniref:CLUMA_CG014866, isoform A n=1 Tax=Clunio marinus TaxID=568069 RepID=A0A1J1IN45_9DIPT|nr:CLUMA_CG014866, isoform A [Clunio marinus]